MKERGVIIFGGYVQGLGLIRSLGREGIPIYLIDDKRICLGRFSRYCTKFAYIPNLAGINGADLKNVLLEWKDVEGWLLLPTDDEMVKILSQNRDELRKHFQVATPEWEVTKYAYNKKLTYEIATRQNIPIPKTLYPESIVELVNISERLAFPVIIKPAVMHTFTKQTGKKAIVAQNKEMLLESYRQACRIIEPSEIIIQDVIPGSPDELYSFCSFFKSGKVIASCVGRRRRQSPMDFGQSSTYVEAVDIPELEELGAKLLKAIDYYGLSEIEFKRDPRDQQFKLLEINPRSWKWHTLVLRAGINLPYLLYQDIYSKETESSPCKVKQNVKWLDFYNDAYVAIKELLAGRMKLRRYLSSLSGEIEPAVASWSDPLPFVVQTIFLPNFTKGEIKQIIASLTRLFHEPKKPAQK